MHPCFDDAGAPASPADLPDRSVVVADPSRPDCPIVFVSDEFERQTGYTAAETLGRNCRFLQGPATDPDAVQAIRSAIDAGIEITVDLVNYRKDGSPFWNRLHIKPLYDHAGRLCYFAAEQNPIGDVERRQRPVDAVLA